MFCVGGWYRHCLPAVRTCYRPQLPTSKTKPGKITNQTYAHANIHRESIPDTNFKNSPKIEFCEFIENSKRSQLQMSPGTPVSNI